jgi:hypothetical protein
MTSLFPPRESLVSDIPAGDGNIEKLFYGYFHIIGFFPSFFLYLHCHSTLHELLECGLRLSTKLVLHQIQEILQKDAINVITVLS